MGRIQGRDEVVLTSHHSELDTAEDSVGVEIGDGELGFESFLTLRAQEPLRGPGSSLRHDWGGVYTSQRGRQFEITVLAFRFLTVA